MSATSTAPSVTFLLCIEAGKFEAMTLMLADSLRRFGGKFANCPVVAVCPRKGPALLPESVAKLKEMNVRLVVRPKASKFPWYGFYNKPAAIETIEHELDTDFVCFLDGDMLLLRSPDLVDLSDGFDFAACPAESSGATTGPTDPNHTYWEKVSGVFGLDVNTFPKVRAYRENVDMHLYWNTGVFSFRRSTGFIPNYVDTIDRMLTCGLSSPVSKLFYVEQSAPSIVVQRLNLKTRQLPYSYNRTFHLPRKANHDTLWVPLDEAQKRELTILHYHRSMAGFDELVEIVRECTPAVAEWLAQRGPIKVREDMLYKLESKIRNKLRKRRFDRFTAAAKVVTNPNAVGMAQVAHA